MPPHNTVELSMQELSKYFKMPEKVVAKHLGICLTSLKKICRANGINRWPYRKVCQPPPFQLTKKVQSRWSKSGMQA